MQLVRFSTVERGGLIVPNTQNSRSMLMPLHLARMGIALTCLRPAQEIDITDTTLPDRAPCRFIVETEEADPPARALVHIVPEPGADGMTPRTYRVPKDLSSFCLAAPAGPFNLALDVRELILPLDEVEIRSLAAIAVVTYN